jgi:hypothetical protein
VGTRYIFLCAAGLFALGVGLRSAPEAGAGHKWGCYEWNSVNLTYDNKATSPYKAHYDEETVTDSNAWSPYTVINFTPGTSGNNVDMFSGSYGQNGWLGLTQIWVSGCTINTAETKLNRSYLDFYPWNGTNTRKVVACHEVGHSTGLNHNPSSTSCLKTGSSTARPNGHDRDQLASMY